MNISEQEFINKLSELKDMAATQGNVISEGQLDDICKEMDLNDEQRGLVEGYLKSQKIGVGEAVDLDEYMTADDKHYIDVYLEELSELPKISQGEKEAYLIQAISGDSFAKNKLIECFLPQVVDIAKIYVGQGVPLEDLIGEGNVALTVLMDMLGSQESPQEAEEMIIQMVMEAMESLISDDYEAKQGFEEWAEKANMVMEKAKELADELMRKVTIIELSKETGMDIQFIKDVCEVTAGAIEVIEMEQ